VSQNNLRNLIHEKYQSSSQIAAWWQKFAAVRRRRVWRLSEQQNHRCCYCATLTWISDSRSPNPEFQPDRLPGMKNRQMATADHLLPVVKGGSEKIENMVMACDYCNQLRGDMPALEFWEIMQDPQKIRALIASRQRRSQRNKAEKTVKRTAKRDGFIIQLGVLLYYSPDARTIADAALGEIIAHLTKPYSLGFDGDLGRIKHDHLVNAAK
jgi:hypothetical protein